MRATLDSSCLISLAWSGLLHLLELAPFELLVPDVVIEEAVRDGLASGHPDAAAIESAIDGLAVAPTQGDTTADSAVLETARSGDVLVTNDAALGRRAVNVGVLWLRTADLVVLLARSGRIDRTAATAGVHALHEAGRVTAELRDDYLEDLQ